MPRSNLREWVCPKEELDELETQLQSRLGNRVRELRLLWTSAGLVLHGCTRTYHNKQLAQHFVLQEAKLPLAANHIEVK
jgi:hypothetical protein